MTRLAQPILALPLLAAGLLATSLAAPAPAGAADPGTVELSYYLPPSADEATSYDAGIPEPAEVLGHQVGEWHVRPDALVRYMEELAEASDRAELREIGRTHEGRPQVVLAISSPQNLARLDELVEAHRALTSGEPPGDLDPARMPVFVYLGYSIHGNEPSGANASTLVAYHLTAGESPEVRQTLDNAVVLLDPALNPDGLGRFAHWANMYRGERPVASPDHREHVEAWPGGRTNHYWFDLNRDWLLLQHPESRNRVRVFQRFRPNVLADFHEMGTSSTFFFQPGVPSRQNPLTPARNLELTREIARFHADALDELGSLYYTEETFDDFYYGKGSTYPDIQGAVGILFEQASARGHVQEKGEGRGVLTFPFAIRNQLTASLSTLRAAVAKREELLAYQRDFYREALDEGASDPARAYVIGDRHDPARVYEMARVLVGHGIRVHELGSRLSLLGETYEPGSAVVVPLDQRQYRLIEALFEERTEFPDTTFYDVSAWTLPHAYGLPWAPVAGARTGEIVGAALPGDPAEVSAPPGRVGEAAGEAPVAWAFEWTGHHAPRALGRLLEAEVAVRVATRPFEATVGDSGAPEDRHPFAFGTIVVPVGVQPERASEIRELLETAAREDGVVVHALGSGLTGGGLDLGSPSLEPLSEPTPLLVIGAGVSPYAAGEIWHHLDHRLGVEVAMADTSYLDRVDLSRYSHLILPDSWGGGLEPAAGERIGEWVRRGGVLVALQSSALWAEEALLGIVEGEPGPDAAEDGDGEAVEPRPYATHSRDVAVPLIAGTIFQAEVDTTHPLAYGYTRERMPVFRDNFLTLTPSDDPYATPVRYTEAPLVAGYVSEENLARLSGTPAVIATRVGGGVVIRMVDDPVFRAFWHGTSRLLTNAVFFGGVIDQTDVPEGVRERH